MKKWLWIIGSLFVGLLLILWIGSPYRHHEGFTYKLLKHTVRINTPADSVFRFLGNSANASKWSVFVHHISPLNNLEVPDGAVGSRRRCFKNANEKGTQWDEVITQVIPNQKRQISCYHMVDFAVSADGLGTEQLYKPLSANSCELSFTLFYLTKEPSFWDNIKTTFAAYQVKSIFRRNMDNIKRIVEGSGGRLIALE